MKALAAVTALLLSGVVLTAQTNGWIPPQSRIEVLLSSPDVLITKDLYRVDDDALATIGVVIDAIVVTARSGTPQTERGIRIELRDSPGRDRTSVSYLDQNEVVALGQALGDMADLAAGWTSRDGARAIEAGFTSVDGFSISFHQDTRNQRAFLTSGFTDPVSRSFSVADLATVKVAIDQAIAILQGK
jgi:hypothetical protein